MDSPLFYKDFLIVIIKSQDCNEAVIYMQTIFILSLYGYNLGNILLEHIEDSGNMSLTQLSPSSSFLSLARISFLSQPNSTST